MIQRFIQWLKSLFYSKATIKAKVPTVNSTVKVKRPIFAWTKVSLGTMIRKTAGGRHGWFESNVGIIRKPL